MALHLAGFDLEIRNRGLQLGVPVDQPLVAIDQPLIVEIDEDLDHRRLKCGSMVNCSRLQSIEQPRRRSWRVIVPPLSAFHSQTFSTNCSRCNWCACPAAPPAGVRPPSAWRSRHGRCPPPTAHPCPCSRAWRIRMSCKRVVERMADMQAAGHVRRRVDDGEGLRIGRSGRTGAALSQWAIPFGLDRAKSKVLSIVMGPRLTRALAKGKPLGIARALAPYCCTR
jgi:hypothetical protein